MNDHIYVFDRNGFRKLLSYMLTNMGAAEQEHARLIDQMYPCGSEEAALALCHCGFKVTVDDAQCWAGNERSGIEFSATDGYRWTERDVFTFGAELLSRGWLNATALRRRAAGRRATDDLENVAVVLASELQKRAIHASQN